MRKKITSILLVIGLAASLRAQVVPEIQVLTPDVCIPGKVSLQVINCSSCVAYDWQIGSSGSFKSGTDQYSTIVTSPGWYDVTVILYASNKAKLAILKKNAFYGRPSPTVKFSVNKTNFCSGGDTLVVTDSSKNIISRDWLIDGNVFYNGPKKIKYLFNGSPGYKSIYLLVRDSYNCKGSLLKDSIVGVWDSIKMNINSGVVKGCAPKYIRFDPDFDTTLQNIKSYYWKFQGGKPDTSKVRNPSNIYYAKGDTFDVRLLLTTKQGCKYNYNYNNIISLGDTALMNIIVPKSKFCVNEKLNLLVTGSKTKLPVWDITGVKYKADSIRGKSINLKFLDTGYAKLRVTDNDRGCISEANYKTPIQVMGPKAQFLSEYPYFCALPKKLIFTNKSIEDPGGTTWKWQVFEKNTTLVSTGTTKDYSYNTNNPYSYGVKLLAVGNNGCKDSIWTPYASTYGKIDTNFKIKPNPACPGQLVTLTSKAGAGTKLSPNFLTWTFYDDKGKITKKITADSATNTYATVGNYSAKLLIWNNENCKDSLKLIDTIHVVSPAAKIAAKDSMLCIGQTGFLYAWGKAINPNLIQEWQIHNIDSVTDDKIGQSDTFAFNLIKTGRYRVKYKLTDTTAKGCYAEYYLPYYLKVSGVSYRIDNAPLFGCSPLSINLTSKLLFDVNYTKKSAATKYAWKTRWPKNVFFTDSTQPNTKAVVNKGSYNVWLVYTNAAGCKDSAQQLQVNSGMNISFDLNSGYHCVGSSARIHNSSSGWIQGWKYRCDSPAIVFNSKTDFEPVLKFTKPGLFKITLVGTYNGCSDSFSVMVPVLSITADFYTPDTVTFCAPRLINFINNSAGAIYNYWTFGDGDSTTTLFNDLAGHLYIKNRNTGYDIKLITRNGYGCVDTLIKKFYVRIIGPDPKFTITNFVGCEPLHVKFTNNSKDFSRMFMDYDNGVVYDSVVISDYNYKVTDKSLPVQSFVPRLLLYDSLGCSALAKSKDTIKVLKNAEAKHSFTSVNFLRKTEGCANDLLIKFTNLSKFFVKTYWDFDNDWKIDISNQNSPSWFYTKPGVFYPVIIAENVNGCRDTFMKDSIVVWEPPVADFGFSTDSTCAIDPIKFYSKTKSKYPIVKTDWNFGETQIYVDTSRKLNPIWKYSAPFDHLVDYVVEDKNGCKNEIMKNIYVFDTAGPAKPELAYISVRNNNFVDCYWRVTKLGNFFRYHAFLDSISLWEKFNSFKRTDTTMIWQYGNQVSNRRFCYTLRLEDTCNQQGKIASSHCTIVLRDTTFEPFNIQLNWLSYDGWSTDLSHYEVYRKDPGGTFKKIADVKSNKQTYTDSFLCDFKYEYYVEAVHKNRIYRSHSNEIAVKPIYKKPEFTVNTTFVSVVNSSFTTIDWEQYPVYYRNFSYVLERSITGIPGSFGKINSLKTLTATDLAADVNKNVNYYQVKFMDHCGNTSEPGVVSNSIFLKAVSQNRNNTALLWNYYKYWYSGVREYGLQLRDKNGLFQTIKTVSPTVVSEDSMDIEKLGLDSICFRVYAVKDTMTMDTSYSNEVCLVPASYAIIPNSFSPDGNNLNEVFKPVTGFIHKKSLDPQARFEFRIYNRWGEEIFLSNDADIGWDGTFLHKPCQPGMYAYSVKALGYDGVPHVLKGTVLLLR